MAYSDYKNLTELVGDATLKLSQVTGVGVQTYSEDRLALEVENVYDSIISLSGFWWPQVMEWFTRTLDGSTGIVTADLTNVEEITDIRAVYFGQQQKPLPYLHPTINPNTMVGTVARAIEALRYDHANVGRLFRVWPLTATGTVYVHARITPEDIFTDPTVTVPFDPALLSTGAALAYAASEGINVAHVAKLQGEYNDLEKSAKQAYKAFPLLLDPLTQFPADTDQWYEHP